MKKVSLAEFHAALKEQGVKDRSDLVFICPMCGTLQTANDLIAAGAGADFSEVEKYIGFSCVGRWTHSLPPPREKDKGTQCGCNWTLGGLFQCHEYEVTLDDGKTYRHFAPASPEQARAYLEQKEKNLEGGAK
jgi:hypothetical protein